MRELKFRTWDKVTNQMRACYGFNDMEREVYVCNVAGDEFKGQLRTVHAIKRKFDDVILMQSTGLFDKNGVEIYEGDIVIAWSQGVKGTFEIKRRTDGLWLLYPAWKDRRFWYLRPTEDGRESCEVIGNIYENKELLEEI